MKTQLAPTESFIFRRTAAQKGRYLAVTPENSSMRHLSYGRIVLDGGTEAVKFQTGPRETGLICLSGSGAVKLDGTSYELGPYDSLYIPRDSSVEVKAGRADFVESSAEVEARYPVQLVRYSSVEKDGSLKFTTGAAANRRTVNILLGKNIQAGRILAGFTRSEAGNWTSWPPHEHADMLEEIYVYYDMPAPSFGLQLVYTGLDEPEFVGIVREGDAVVLPKGFHPNVAVPGHPINFVWIMAAHRELEDRQFGVVNVQPGFGQTGSGLEASRK
jgi:5-deoxy-glucuronate isomerase